jgi:TolB-like protein
LPTSNKTVLRLPQSHIDRIRVIARERSQAFTDRDVTWQEVGREVVERALLAEERDIVPPQLA